MTVVSIRFSDEPVHDRLREAARRSGIPISTLAERLINEGLRMQSHPMIVFRDGPTGRRPVLVGGPEVIDVVGSIVGGDVPVDERRERAGNLLGLPLSQIDAALAYYAEYTDEVDAALADRAEEAARHEALWRRQRGLLAR